MRKSLKPSASTFQVPPAANAEGAEASPSAKTAARKIMNLEFEARFTSAFMGFRGLCGFSQ
jgi:hypothetical protein